MSSFAIAYDFARIDRRSRLSRKNAARAMPLPWTNVPVVDFGFSRAQGRRASPIYVWWLVGVAIAVHAALGWYATHYAASEGVQPRKHEVAVELVRPPKPLEPKIEPPKPVPPKPELKKPAQVLPLIQTAVSDPSDLSDSVSSEPSIAVAPVATVPAEPAPESVTAPIGHAGYLNNPAPDYPSVAVRQRWQGTVLLRVHVRSDGKVESIEVQESSGRKLLDEQALRTVKTWLFTPSKRGETPIDGWATVPIEFKLDS